MADQGKNGASEGIRTLDIHLGKVTLYQAELRSRPEPTVPTLRKCGREFKKGFLRL